MLKPTASPETSYSLITPPDAPHYVLRQGQSVQQPKPIIGYFAPPVYPKSLANPGMPSVVIKAQLVFGTDGKVAGVYILPGSYAGPGEALFEAAVRNAVKDWAFTPLVFVQQAGGNHISNVATHVAKPFSLWFGFRFDMVDGKPAVETVNR